MIEFAYALRTCTRPVNLRMPKQQQKRFSGDGMNTDLLGRAHRGECGISRSLHAAMLACLLALPIAATAAPPVAPKPAATAAPATAYDVRVNNTAQLLAG